MSRFRIFNSIKKIKIRITYGLVFLILLGWSIMLSSTDHWSVDRIQSDVINYYAYLPATFICKDITLKNSCCDKFWFETAPNGGKVIKGAIGMSIAYFPFFMIGHFAAPLFHETQDGYSDPYQKMILLASLLYALLGLIFTFKSLKIFFSERVAFISSSLLFLSTNLLYYSTLEPGMPHTFLFGLCSVFIYLVIKWHEHVSYIRAGLIGIILGFMILIRPTSILFFLLFVLYNIKTKKDILEKISFLFKNFSHLIVIGICVFIMYMPQLAYWKYITGQWIYYSYGNETFFWKNPHIVEGLFGFRKGWFIYTPAMFLACIGIFYLRKYVRPLFLPVLVFLPLFCYIMFSWWAWWYGGSFGQRTFVDTYGLMAFPLAGIVAQVSQKKIIKYILSLCFAFLIVLNFFQSWQKTKGLIHWDSMTRTAYFMEFGTTKQNPEYYHSLWTPDYYRASQGKSEYFELDEFYNSNIAITTYNLQFLSLCNGDTLAANTFVDRQLQHFTIQKIGDKLIALRAANNKYVGVDRNNQNRLYVKSDTVGDSEKFNVIFSKENYITLISSAKKYVRINYDTNFLVADSDILRPECRLRVYFEK